MKIISPEEEAAHYRAVLEGGFIGGTVCLGLGWAGVVAASRRYTGFRRLTLPFRSFLVTSSATFGAIVNAERYSNAFHTANNPMSFYKTAATRAAETADAQKTTGERFREWGRQNRYTIVSTSWVTSVAAAMAIVSRDRHLTASQKIMQARVYAQALTLLVLIATAAFETADRKAQHSGGAGRWDIVKVLDPGTPRGNASSKSESTGRSTRARTCGKTWWRLRNGGWQSGSACIENHRTPYRPNDTIFTIARVNSLRLPLI